MLAAGPAHAEIHETRKNKTASLASANLPVPKNPSGIIIAIHEKRPSGQTQNRKHD
jgi:hypothetical protein